MPVISLIASIAISVPMTPVTAPSTPTASQLGRSVGVGRHRIEVGELRVPPGRNTVTCPSNIDTAPDTSGSLRRCGRLGDDAAGLEIVGAVDARGRSRRAVRRALPASSRTRMRHDARHAD